MVEIQCRCGATCVELMGQPIAQFFCHCDDCQAASGADYIPVAMYPAAAVTVTRGSPAAWKLKTTPRTKCIECGTFLFAEPPFGVRGVNGALLRDGSFRPMFHIQCQYAVRPISDGLTHFKSFPATFGGSDDKVDW